MRRCFRAYSPAMSAPTGFLSRTPFFGGLPGQTLQALASLLEARTPRAGEFVFRQGDPGRSMYVVEGGELAAFQASTQGPAVEIMRFQAGDFFGETTLIEQRPRPFAVMAETDARLWELDHLELYRLYRADVKGYVLILQNINRELCRRLRSAGLRLKLRP